MVPPRLRWIRGGNVQVFVVRKHIQENIIFKIYLLNCYSTIAKYIITTYTCFPAMC